MSPSDAEAWLRLGVPGILMLVAVGLFWLFQRERTEHLMTLRRGQEIAIEFARTVESMTRSLERTRR
jgi:hypothetical protein